MTLMQLALDASTMAGKKRQKSSLLRYWAMYCAEFRIDMHSFGSYPQATESEAGELIRKEFLVLAGFASFVVTYPRRAGQSHNSTAHAERVVCVVRGYYENMYGRFLGMRRAADFIRTLRGVTRGLRKLYTTTPMVRVPLLADDLRAIRKVMDLKKVRHATY